MQDGVPIFVIQEEMAGAVPWYHEVVRSPIKAENGHWLVPELPGARTNSAVNQSLNKLFADAQSLPDFDPNQFTKDLNTFHSSVAGFLETK